MHDNGTNRIPTHKKPSSTGHLYPVASIRSFEHVKNLPTDRTEQNLISPDTERIHRMRNGQEMHANGHKRTGNFTVRYASVSAIR